MLALILFTVPLLTVVSGYLLARRGPHFDPAWSHRR